MLVGLASPRSRRPTAQLAEVFRAVAPPVMSFAQRKASVMGQTVGVRQRSGAGVAVPSRGVRLYVPGRDHRRGVHHHVHRGGARCRRGRVRRRAGTESERPPGPSRRGRRAVALGVGALVLVLGILVPALVIASAKDAKTAPGGVKLTASDERGREILAQQCATCHTLAAAHAVGKVRPNLDQLVGPLDPNGVGGTKQQQAFVLGAIRQGRANGRGQMPANLVDGEDAQDVAKFVAVVAGH